ncbi:hypothetical protein MP228_004107 [Amoeboaphelidium protococcarum]|nr:hypothetical protein MP228_004107 [Amoeboaphelidium protococcarum]
MPFTCLDLLRIVAAVILPPLGVFLQVGCNQDVLINILLTLLGFIPENRRDLCQLSRVDKFFRSLTSRQIYETLHISDSGLTLRELYRLYCLDEVELRRIPFASQVRNLIVNVSMFDQYLFDLEEFENEAGQVETLQAGGGVGELQSGRSSQSSLMPGITRDLIKFVKSGEMLRYVLGQCNQITMFVYNSQMLIRHFDILCSFAAIRGNLTYIDVYKVVTPADDEIELQQSGKQAGDVIQLLKKFTNLKHLRIGSDKLTTEVWLQIMSIDRRNLLELRLYQVSEDFNLHEWSRAIIEKAPNLRVLGVSLNRIINCEAFRSLRVLQNLVTFDIESKDSAVLSQAVTQIDFKNVKVRITYHS